MVTRTGENCTEVVKSLPPTLEFKEIRTDNWPKLIWNQGVVTQYPRGSSETIDLETLFPRLHTLKLGEWALRTAQWTDRPSLPSSCFPALPSSLTRLDAYIRISSSDSVLMSSLPPNIQHISLITWKMDLSTSISEENAFDALRRNFARAPPSLVTMESHACSSWSTQKQFDTSSFECILPKSLTTQDWIGMRRLPWCPSVARTMPPYLQSLRLDLIDSRSFVGTFTNWIADFPRSLTELQVDTTKALDFTSHVRFLPRGLKSLTLTSPEKSKGLYGDWSIISTGDWPSALETLMIGHPRTEAAVLANLPTTLTRSVIHIDSPQLPFDGTLLPSRLTALILSLNWTSLSDSTSLSHLALKSITLTVDYVVDLTWDWLSRLPNTIEFLRLGRIRLVAPPYTKRDDKMLPMLTTFALSHLSYRCLALLPRGIRTLEIFTLDIITQFGPVSKGHLFKKLPPALTKLTVTEIEPNDGAALAPQELGHLRCLRDLELGRQVSSGQFRMLPRSLRRLSLKMWQIHLPDVAFIPPCLETCDVSSHAELINSLPLRSLSSLRYLNSNSVMRIAQRRVQEAAQYP